MPYDERDEKTGKFTETYSKDEVLDAVDSLSGSASTQEVADHIGCAYRTAYQKLQELEKENRLNSKKVANAHLWETSE